MRRRRGPRASRGFTLIEVLVAVTILAIALAAAARATSLSINGVIDARERMLATWVAQNRIGLHQAAPRGTEEAYPNVGDRSGEEEQAGVRYKWVETVSGTPNPFMRRIEVKVYSPSVPDYMIARVVTLLVRTQ